MSGGSPASAALLIPLLRFHLTKRKRILKIFSCEDCDQKLAMSIHDVGLDVLVNMNSG